MEQEKRIRREIANSNERRRMQSINAGFQSLRTLLPHHDGEKLSKPNTMGSATATPENGRIAGV
ncbi:activator protein, putative [Ixodes scapularis]|uniref:Activator protein, putative n=1 Tax=Ixodes scapularis TaxID=6945 RepID=B7QFT2_IXOSC|nr:activator protein, putative [Ixodes scapularis]|eukprot:XP_002400892.1 activator protein, putative [Ixodes scapularis]